MKVTVNGKPKTLKEGATLKQAVAGEHYIEGSDISVHLSTEKVTEVSNDFARSSFVITLRGIFTTPMMPKGSEPRSRI